MKITPDILEQLFNNNFHIEYKHYDPHSEYFRKEYTGKDIYCTVSISTICKDGWITPINDFVVKFSKEEYEKLVRENKLKRICN